MMSANHERTAQDHPRRHGRLLRVGGAARRSVTAWQAGGRGMARRPIGGVCGLLRSPRVRRALGDAGAACRTPVSGCDLRAAGLRTLQGGVTPSARDLPAPYRSGRAAVAGRGLPGRDRAEERHRAGHRYRPHHPHADP
ncbi:hypothetical protein G6F65_015703 [Rhizopus arrhizus]|uniref:Uncharacterized protein n=1 Tax=Rhizopus delemar TaxID=936053 RepID=A0A9P6Y0N4_9FUNG|nr:hypothetical protein G6F65_015703 [Rhizopus arrhizus]KAG1536097.1 hypothetical protein G6F50_015157 [Rhizopus delemar]